MVVVDDLVVAVFGIDVTVVVVVVAEEGAHHAEVVRVVMMHWEFIEQVVAVNVVVQNLVVVLDQDGLMDHVDGFVVDDLLVVRDVRRVHMRLLDAFNGGRVDVLHVVVVVVHVRIIAMVPVHGIAVVVVVHDDVVMDEGTLVESHVRIVRRNEDVVLSVREDDA